MKNPIRILVVDDHAMVRQGIRAFIGTASDLLVVGEGVDGEDAIEQVRRLEPDVIVLDLKMPRRNGVEVIRHLRQHHPQVKVVVLTFGGDGEEGIRAAYEAGALKCLTKGGRPEILLDTIYEIVGGGQAEVVE